MGRNRSQNADRLPHVSRLTPLAATFLAVFAWAHEVSAATWTVNTANNHCGDGGGASGQGDTSTNTGNLRFATYFADPGDTINVLCSTITLTQGALYITQNNLTINGVKGNDLVVTQTAQDRVIYHRGDALLSLNYVNMSGGYYYSTIGAYGGCIYSKGSVELYQSSVTECKTESNGGDAHGGGIFTKGALSLIGSSVSYNKAIATNKSSANARGGGAFVQGEFTSMYGRIDGNLAEVTGSDQGRGGGLHLAGNASISYSVISGNSAGQLVGGVDITSSTPASLVARISNSTISGNSATYLGGVYANSGTVEILSSTIAFNTATKGKMSGTEYAAGVVFDANVAAMSVNLQSSLIANNTYGSTTTTPKDLTVTHTSSHSITFNAAPANNLIYATGAAVASDTIKSKCPLLGPLRNNGGQTDTHALMSGSPALAVGNDVADVNFDQRGAEYLRVSHGASVADIGAYEMQRTDVIFVTNFESCP